MDVLVCIKRVPLSGGKLTITDDGRDIETAKLGFTISPHEEVAVEEAVRIVEQHGGSVTVLTLGPTEAEEQIREQMAIGADRGILIETDGEEWDPQGTASAIAENEPYAIDDDSDYTVPVHGEARGLDAVLVEIRQDLISDDEGAASWASRLAQALKAIEKRQLIT